MGSRDKFQVIEMIKLTDHLTAKKPAGASGTQFPSQNVIRVGPHHVAEGTVVRNLLVPVDKSDLVDRPDIRTEASVDTKYRVFN